MEKTSRDDDRDINVIKTRMNVYKSQTEPVKHYYQKQGKLKVIDAGGTPDEVFNSICMAIDEVMGSDAWKDKNKIL